jgi:hypothetical protein
MKNPPRKPPAGALTLRAMPVNHGAQIIELWTVYREIENSAGDFVEIAENPDGSIKAYATEAAAIAAAGPGWKVDTIWLLHKGYSDLPAAFVRAAAGRHFLRDRFGE